VTKQDSRTDLPSDISPMALLGFASPGGMEAVQLEEIQARSIRERAMVHMATNLFCALLVVAISYGSAPLWAIGSWAGTLLGYKILWYTTLRNKDVSGRRQAIRRDFLDMGRNAGISGIIWGSALPFLGIYGAMPQWLGLWSVSLAMMVYASMVIPSLPIAATAFISVATLGGLIGWTLHGEYYLALANAALGTLMIFGVLRSAKAQVLFELASNVLHEKSETVSLLLREFEDSGADCFGRPIPGAVSPIPARDLPMLWKRMQRRLRGSRC
jgi:hypothetical protein